MQIGNIGNNYQNLSIQQDQMKVRQQETAKQPAISDGFSKNEVKDDTYSLKSFANSGIKSTEEVKSAAPNLAYKLNEQAAETGLKMASSMVMGPLSSGLSEMKILYTNDIHGGILPYEQPDKPGIEFGGMSQLSSSINDAIKDRDSTLILDGGDWAQGTYVSGRDKGQTLMQIMNAIGYDASEIGNHDFDWGREGLDNMIATQNFPTLGANIINTSDGTIMKGVQPYITKEINGTKVGIIGVTSPRTANDTAAANTVGLKFEDNIKTVKKYINELKKQGTEMFVVVSHCGDTLDKQMAKAIPELDVIVGAHSHKTFEKPIVVGDTLILQSGSGARNLGELDLTFDKQSGKIVNYNNTIKHISSENSKKDPKIEAILEPMMADINAEMNKVVGNTSVILTRRGKLAETIMGNLVTDSLRYVTGADVGFVNSGGIRAEIGKGPITYGEVYSVLPSDNNVVTMDLTGKQLKGVMEESAGRARGTIEVSGMKMDIDPRKPAGQRVFNITVNGEPLDLNKTYKVATNDFLSTGGNGYTDLTQGKHTADTGIAYRDALVKYFEHVGSFDETNAKVEGRQNYLAPKPTY